MSGISSTLHAQPGFIALQTRCTPEFQALEPGALQLPKLDISAIVNGQVSFEDLVNRGREIFTTRFELCDGQSRPANAGNGALVAIDPTRPLLSRLSGPDSNACADCHDGPTLGGSGGFVQDAFAGALPGILSNGQTGFQTEIDTGFENPRNPPALNGACVEELLSREITRDLQAQLSELNAEGASGRRVLTSKGIEFEIVLEDGEVIESEGVNPDLIIRPFNLAGSTVSIRAFEVDALNVHFGMQAEEAFDLNPERGPDFDQDGIEQELTIGDITGLVTFICSLPIPQQVIPDVPEEALQIAIGERNFNSIGCNRCHINELTLNDTTFIEPSEFNEESVLSDQSLAIRFDAIQSGNAPRLPINADGSVTVRAFTDFKRHNLCDPEGSIGAIRHFCNEQFLQGRQAEQDGRPGAEFFLTKDLWDVGNTEPYGHRGDLTTVTEAILAHGGEARTERDAFTILTTENQAAILRFLDSLQVPTTVGSNLAFVPGDVSTQPSSEQQNNVVVEEETVDDDAVDDDAVDEEEDVNNSASAASTSNSASAASASNSSNDSSNSSAAAASGNGSAAAAASGNGSAAAAASGNSPQSADAAPIERLQRTILEQISLIFRRSLNN